MFTEILRLEQIRFKCVYSKQVQMPVKTIN